MGVTPFQNRPNVRRAAVDPKVVLVCYIDWLSLLFIKKKG